VLWHLIKHESFNILTPNVFAGAPGSSMPLLNIAGIPDHTFLVPAFVSSATTKVVAISAYLTRTLHSASAKKGCPKIRQSFGMVKFNSGKWA
jgi:hypothetical protein